MKSFFEMYQILQAKKLFEQDGADGGGVSMGGGDGGMDMGNAPGGVDLGTNGQAGGLKPQNQVPTDQQDTMGQMDMGDDDSQLSEPVGAASKSEQKEKIGEIKGLLEDIMASAKSGQPLDDETTQKLKQALDQVSEFHDSMESDEEEEGEGEEGEEGGEEKPEEGSESAGGDMGGMDMSGMDMSGMGGGAPQGGGAQAPQGGQPAGGGNTQMPSMNFGM
jgi:hypothetical protein